MTTPNLPPSDVPETPNGLQDAPPMPSTPEPVVEAAPKPSRVRGCLHIIGWVYLPFFMLPWRWKELSQKQRLVGALWAAVMVFVWITANSGPRVTRTYVEQPAPVEEQQAAPAQTDPCAAAVQRFASDVRLVVIRADGLRERMQKYQDNTYTARELEVQVPAAFRDLEGLEVPSCRPEPAQIVAALNRVRDAEVLAFIEMSTAEAGGSSRETALNEVTVQLPIVERELEQVDAWLRGME